MRCKTNTMQHWLIEFYSASIAHTLGATSSGEPFGLFICTRVQQWRCSLDRTVLYQLVSLLLLKKEKGGVQRNNGDNGNGSISWQWMAVFSTTVIKGVFLTATATATTSSFRSDLSCLSLLVSNYTKVAANYSRVALVVSSGQQCP